ncbi:ABC transporter ATP-binding protein, partial [Klebsiella pneumoniae]
MLHIEDLCVVRGQDHQAHRVYLPQLSLRPGEVVAVTGESGCGKSTLLEAIGLVLHPSKIGRYTLSKGSQQQDIAALLLGERHNTLAAIRARELGFVLQNGGLLPYLNVKDNILLPCQLLGARPDSTMLDRV